VSKRLAALVLFAGLVCVTMALAATDTTKVTDPPTGFPPVLWAVLGVLLPWFYGAVLGKLAGWLKFLASWGTALGICVLVGLLLLHYSPGQLLQSIGWLVLAMQAVYELMTKPAFRRLAARPSLSR
jgi:hypothetical protein